MLHRCLPRQVEPYLFDDGEVRSAPFDFGALRGRGPAGAGALRRPGSAPFDFGALRGLVQRHAGDLAARVEARAHVDAFTDNLERVVARLRSRLQWAMQQIARLNALRERRGTLEPEDEALFRRCDRLVKRLKGTDRRLRRAPRDGSPRVRAR